MTNPEAASDTADQRDRLVTFSEPQLEAVVAAVREVLLDYLREPSEGVSEEQALLLGNAVTHLLMRGN